MATTKPKKKQTITCGGFTVAQSVQANADAMRRAKTDFQKMEALDYAKAAFDRNCTRVRDFAMLCGTAGISQADIDFLDLCAGEHRRAAIGLAKLIWKVK